MNAKQKADYLSIKFCDNSDVVKPNFASIKMAIKCCDEIINALKVTLGHITLTSIDYIESCKDLDFWHQVKNELEIL